MSYVELGRGGFYQHVVYVYLHGRSYMLLEHLVHQPLIGSSCVLEPKWHHTITIGSLRCDKRGLFLVVWVHANLVVAREGIHKTEEVMASGGIHDEVDSRQRETVFWACFVDVSEVDAESPLAVRFFFISTTLANHSGYSTSLIAPAWRSLPTSSLIAFYLSGTKLLLFCLTGLKDGLTFSLCGVNLSHICLLPCEDIFVLSQKMGERAFEVLC